MIYLHTSYLRITIFGTHVSNEGFLQSALSTCLCPLLEPYQARHQIKVIIVVTPCTWRYSTCFTILHTAMSAMHSNAEIRIGSRVIIIGTQVWENLVERTQNQAA